MEININEEELHKKIAQYQTEKTELDHQIRDLEKEIIIKEERIKQVQENLVNTYGTSDPDELVNIVKKLENEIIELEKNL